jgi:succinate dehydrogenase/fumarate reductase flavoprotein subunit
MAMKLEQIADEIIETDFLIIGGGLAGCMAALRARQKGNIDVAIMERATIKYSGDSIGVDDHSDWRPEYYKAMIAHPLPAGFPSEKALKRPKTFGPDQLRGGLISWNLAVNAARNYAGALLALEQIGVNMVEDDDTIKIRQEKPVPGLPHWHHPFPDENGKIDADWIMYRGTDLKQKLANAVLKSGTRVFSRTLLTGLITRDGSIVGATGVNTRTGKFRVFKAKTVLLATGGIRRIYPYPYAPFPNNLFFSRSCAGNHGGGVVAAYRAGARLASLEFIYIRIVSAGACTTSGVGGGWYWNLKNSKGEVIGMWNAFEPNVATAAIERDIFTFDRGTAVNEAIVGCYFTAATEYPRALKLHKMAGGMGKGDPVEVRPFLNGITHGGVLPVTENAESSIKNLFVAGDASCGLGDSGSKAVVWGFIVGEHVRELVPEMKKPVFNMGQVQYVESEKQRALAPLTRQGTVEPLELEDYVRKINLNYIGVHKVAPRLKRAADIMKMIQERYSPALTADDPHDLMRAIEVQDIIQLSELHAGFSLLRNESRDTPNHYRVDYPRQDDEHWKNTIVTARNVAGEAKYEIERNN